MGLLSYFRKLRHTSFARYSVFFWKGISFFITCLPGQLSTVSSLKQEVEVGTWYYVGKYVCTYIFWNGHAVLLAHACYFYLHTYYIVCFGENVLDGVFCYPKISMQHGFIRSNLLIIGILVHIVKYTTYLICIVKCTLRNNLYYNWYWMTWLLKI